MEIIMKNFSTKLDHEIAIEKHHQEQISNKKGINDEISKINDPIGIFSVN
jgi:hypothetical protein